GIPRDRVHFLNMPFYDTGSSRKSSLTAKDISLVKDTLVKLKPDQVYVSGDLSDPNATRRLAFESLAATVRELQDPHYRDHCYFWLYQGETQEWGVDQIDMAVPLSPDELSLKMQAILKYQSQRNRQGIGERAGWEIARS